MSNMRMAAACVPVVVFWLAGCAARVDSPASTPKLRVERPAAGLPVRTVQEITMTDDSAVPVVRLTDGVIFQAVSPPGKERLETSHSDDRSAVPYELAGEFTRDREQTVWIYRLATASDASGLNWERVAFLNNRFQGPTATATVLLEPGVPYLLVGWHKPSYPPLVNDEPWHQSALIDAPAPVASKPEQSGLQITFNDGSATGHARAYLRPVAKHADRK